MADNDMEIKVRATIDGVESAMNTVVGKINGIKEAVENFTGPITRTVDSLKRLGEAFLVFEAVDKIEAFVEKLEDMATTALKLSAVLGVTVEKVSEFRGVLIAVGGNEASGTIRTMQHLQREMSQSLADPAGRAAQAFQHLGISAKQVQANMTDFTSMMALLRNTFQNNIQGANLTAAMYAILGRSFDTLVPVLRLTDDEFQKATDRFRETASNIAPFKDRLFESGELLRTFEQSLTGLALVFYDKAQPAMDAFVEAMTRHVQSTTKAIAADESLKKSLESVGLALSEQSASWDKWFSTDTTSKLTFWGVAMHTVADAIALATAAWAGFVYLFMVTMDGITHYIKLFLMGIESIAKVMAKLATGKWSEISSTWDQAMADMGESGRQFTLRMQGYLDDMGRAGARAIAVITGTPLPGRGGGQGYGGPEPMGLPTREPPPSGGRGHSTKEPHDYMKEWTEALQKTQIATNDFFDKAKKTELDYWTEKRDWTKTHMAEIMAQWEKDGLQKDAAQKKYDAMLYQEDVKVFNLLKANRVADLADFKTKIDEEQTANKTAYDNKTITEADWYEKSKATLDKYFAELIRLNAVGTKQWDAALKERAKLDEEHITNTAKMWGDAFSWIDSHVNTMLTGVLQGTQTWSKAMQDFFKNMALSFVTYLAQMTLRWLAFKALMQLGIGGEAAAKGVGGAALPNFLGGVASAVGGFFGKAASGAAGGAAGGGGVGGAAAGAGTAALTTALTKTTASVVANTASTAANTGGIVNWITQQLASIAQFLGLTAATTTEIGTTADLTINILLLMEVMVELATVSIPGLISALASLTFALSVQTATSIVPHAEGAWKIANDHVALVHAGEMIIPTSQAEMLRNGSGLNFATGRPSVSSVASGSGGGGGDTHIHIHAMDTRSFQQWLSGPNAAIVMGALGQQVRNGNAPIFAASGAGRR